MTMKMPKPEFTLTSAKAPLTPSIFDNYEKVNRLIIIGNGFDIAHGLKSRFKDFIYNYLLNLIKQVITGGQYDDPLISITTTAQFPDAEQIISKSSLEDAFNLFINNLSRNPNIKIKWKSGFFNSLFLEIERKNWIDIEIRYFLHLKQRVKNSNRNDAVDALNSEFEYLKSRFIEYLNKELDRNEFTYHPNLLAQFEQPIKKDEARPNTIRGEINPERICILNFNYTHIAELYGKALKNKNYTYIPIHGQLQTESTYAQEPVFGFGDEMDPDYTNFELLTSDAVFAHIKSFKYLQSNHYRNLLGFIESGPYQVQIFGHSCGISDRTLLNTIFENEECISIKPFYHEFKGKDDYEQKSFSIARHFKSKAELRAKVVNKQYCEAMVQPITNTL